MFANQISNDDRFDSNELIDKSASAPLDESLYWTHGLKAMCEKGR